jgi:hypothetical protein
MKDILATEPWTFIACHSFDNILLAGDDSHNVTLVPHHTGQFPILTLQFLGLGTSEEDRVYQIESSPRASNDFSQIR